MKNLAVKFCGFTRTDNLQTAIALGVNAVGLVFYPLSPRAVSIATAQTLVSAVPAFTTIVALVVNMGQDELVNLAKEVAFDIIQFHGDETPAKCQTLARAVNKRWIKAIRVKNDDTSDTLLNQINALKAYGASGVILDAFSDTAYGGTGLVFDWTKIPDNSPLPIYLAGGLTPDAIGEIVNNQALMAKIKGVDVSGGIEKEKGVKCEIKMSEFIKNMVK
ncbi:phosphoribosylanthranilate isomerase [Moraxella bovis]|uniref:N-(5'-phosphoribosyl)anthranilate isomerase n=1 Tax=Moraxella bovis TaxID=476 RepID=A0A1T0A3V4_MORBO|nr:phosphoribosylanthranilate isomerase [Moraxella bovis]AWY21033.1 phosphoribosylanthranilate isomerase [Moraxella bovis]OOR90278.1 N-(5'-phosphoribosyl)anthranilate isomerase [Moraxella bovis]UYZ68998.1 phosphoribosylanthranilate isomerase [Moraxella bovis]UYZ71372.1 phosphoribosylanthranilate isomerase [Moraxella bovis]UYZ72715.1 phosphoribosylanthranilate isomerase [Moraxella bovis]